MLFRLGKDEGWRVIEEEGDLVFITQGKDGRAGVAYRENKRRG